MAINFVLSNKSTLLHVKSISYGTSHVIVAITGFSFYMVFTSLYKIFFYVIFIVTHFWWKSMEVI